MLIVLISGHFWCSLVTSVTFSSNLSKFENYPKNPKKSHKIQKTTKNYKNHKKSKKPKIFSKCFKIQKNVKK